jgi:hypothetical protein
MLPDDFGNHAEIISSGDFDGDGMDDILWRDPASGDVDIWGLTGDLPHGDLEAAGDSWDIIGSGDFDGDGIDDVLLREFTSERLAVRLSTRGEHEVIDSDLNDDASERQLAATGDYNADDRTDLVVRDLELGETWIWFLNGATVVRGEQIEDPGDRPRGRWKFATVDRRNPHQAR